MRLKEDSDSYKSSNVSRKVAEIPEETRAPRAKKDTRRWCKGKVGVSHEYVLKEEHKWFSIDECVNCGKQQHHSDIKAFFDDYNN